MAEQWAAGEREACLAWLSDLCGRGVTDFGDLTNEEVIMGYRSVMEQVGGDG